MIYLLLLKTLLSNPATGTVEAAPIKFSSRPTSDSASPSYVSNPRGRGTANVLLTSIITLMLCVYTSIHLNIAPDSHMFSITIPRFRLFLKRKKLEDTPESNSHNTKKPYRVGIKRATVYKFYWVIIALLAPEFVFYAALSQWKEASALREALQKIQVETNDGEPQPPDEQVPGTDDGEPQPPDEQVPGTDGGSTPLVRVGVDIPPKDAIADGDGLEEVPRADGESLVEGDTIESAEQRGKRRVLEFLKPTLVSSAEKTDWSSMSMTSAFFVIMGGFAYRRGYDFKIPESDLKFPHLMLTPEGFLELAKEGVLHPGILDDKAITDRSKADWLAKFLVCAQAFWMVFNVIARKASDLPSTLIELNVIVHVVVMVVVYGLWWDKPLAVQNPIILNPSPKYIDEHTTILPMPEGKYPGGFITRSIMRRSAWYDVSYLYCQIIFLHIDDYPLKSVDWFPGWMNEIPNGSKSIRREIFKHNHPRLFQFHRFFGDKGDYQDHPISLLTAEEHHQRYSDISIPEGLEWNYFVAAEIDSNSDKNKGKEARGTAVKDLDVNVKNCSKGLLLLPGQVLLSNAKDCTYVGNRTYEAVTRYRRPVFLTGHQMRLIEQLTVIFDEYPLEGFSCSWATPDTSNIILNGILHWSQAIKGSKWCPVPVLTIGGTILSLIYAGCHATAWNSHFPSFTERYLWRGACIVIAAGGPTFLVSNAIHHIVKAKDYALDYNFFRELRESHPFPCGLPRYIFYRLPRYMHMAVGFFVNVCTLLYTLARIFIIVEAFISIRSLPAGAYDSVDWIEMLPHV